jgi:hypothetical protein
MIEADAPSTRWRLRYFPQCASPTGGSHTRTYNEVPRNAEGGGAKSIGRVV